MLYLWKFTSWVFPLELQGYLHNWQNLKHLESAKTSLNSRQNIPKVFCSSKDLLSRVPVEKKMHNKPSHGTWYMVNSQHNLFPFPAALASIQGPTPYKMTQVWLYVDWLQSVNARFHFENLENWLNSLRIKQHVF